MDLLILIIIMYHMKSLKILNRKSESVNRRRIDNTMAKRKRTKGQITIYKTLHKKPKIEKHEPHLKPVMNAGAPGGLAVSVPLVASIVLLI